MNKFSEIVYQRPDYAACERALRECAETMRKATTYEELKRAFLSMQALAEKVENQCVVCSVRNTLDKTDEYYDAEQEANDAGTANLALAKKECQKALVESPFRQLFDQEYGEYLTRMMETDLKLVNEEIVPDMIEEERLGQTYARDAALCKTEFRGESCNFYGLLKHMESTDREERREAFLAWAALYESVSDKLDNTYDELVALRVKKAKKLGFDNFIDYIYPARGRLDYTAADVACFRDQVRDVIVPVCAGLYAKQAERLGIERLHWYDEALVFPEGNAIPIGTKDELVEKALNMYREMSPETGEFFTFMKEHELFDLETRPGKHLGGYCTFLPEEKAPFIFSNFNGTSADVDVLTHEAGHAFEAYVASRTQPLSDEAFSTSEINEIHSMSMEHFAYPWMESFFGENVKKYRYAHLVSALCSIPYLVAVDEFQHRVFENPEMSAMERRKAWHEVEQTYLPWRDYDGNKFLSEGGFWMQKQHIFLYPFYYVDYALAQICAFQFLIKDREDHQAAWSDYLQLCRRGGSMGYFDLLKSAGLMNPFCAGTVEKVISEVVKVIEDFEKEL